MAIGKTVFDNLLWVGVYVMLALVVIMLIAIAAKKYAFAWSIITLGLAINAGLGGAGFTLALYIRQHTTQFSADLVNSARNYTPFQLFLSLCFCLLFFIGFFARLKR